MGEVGRSFSICRPNPLTEGDEMLLTVEAIEVALGIADGEGSLGNELSAEVAYVLNASQKKGGMPHDDVLKRFVGSKSLVVRILNMLTYSEIASVLALASKINDQASATVMRAWAARQATFEVLGMRRSELTRAQTARLYLSHPTIYRERKQPAGIEGFQVDQGWFDLVAEMSGFLEEIACDQKTDGKKPLKVSTVAMQCGQLQVAGEGLSRDGPAFAAVQYAREAAEQTCDVCGRPGQLSQTKIGTQRIRCTTHNETKNE